MLVQKFGLLLMYRTQSNMDERVVFSPRKL